MYARLITQRSWPHMVALMLFVGALLAMTSTDGGWPSWSQTWALSSPGLRVTGLIIVIALGTYGAFALGEIYNRSIHKRWWDPADTFDGELTWRQLLELVQRDSEPLAVPPRLRVGPALFGMALLACGSVALAGLTETAARFVWRPALPSILLPDAKGHRLSPDALLNLGGNLGALLALLAASVSIWFTYHQLRAKVKADNRQAWLARTRTLLSQVVALAAAHAEAEENQRAQLFGELDPIRLELELMLNPSEKDHRLLMYLLRRLTFIAQPNKANAADEGVLVGLIRDNCEQLANRSSPYAERYQADWLAILRADKVAPLVTYCMRLGHVVLKREWERVKATR